MKEDKITLKLNKKVKEHIKENVKTGWHYSEEEWIREAIRDKIFKDVERFQTIRNYKNMVDRGEEND